MGLFSFTQEIAMDLGTANTIILNNGNIVVDEPSVVALDRRTDKMIAVGERAKLMYEKENPNIRTVRPLRDGVIADFNACEQMMRGLIKKVNVGNRFFTPSLRMVILEVIERCDEFGFLETIGHKKKNLHKYLFFREYNKKRRCTEKPVQGTGIKYSVVRVLRMGGHEGYSNPCSRSFFSNSFTRASALSARFFSSLARSSALSARAFSSSARALMSSISSCHVM